MDNVNISENPLSKQQKVFLESENPKGFNKSAYQSEIMLHLEKSLRYLYHITKNPSNLKKLDLYDILNSLTLNDIIRQLLLDFEQKTAYRPEKYDFRTVELARTLFHISTNYLIKSPLWNNKDFVKTDIQRLSYYFQVLAESALDKVSHELIKENDERKMLEDLEKIKKEEEYIKYNHEGKWYIFNKQYEKCNQKLVNYNSRITVLDAIKKKNKKIKDEIEIIKALLEGLQKVIYKVQDLRESSLKDVTERRNDIVEKLSHKFEHLKGVYCPYDRLGPFEYEGRWSSYSGIIRPLRLP